MKMTVEEFNTLIGLLSREWDIKALDPQGIEARVRILVESDTAFVLSVDNGGDEGSTASSWVRIGDPAKAGFLLDAVLQAAVRFLEEGLDDPGHGPAILMRLQGTGTLARLYSALREEGRRCAERDAVNGIGRQIVRAVAAHQARAERADGKEPS